MSGGSSRAFDRKRASSRRLSTGLTAVIPSAEQTAELADEPRPWQRIFLSLAKRTMSSTVRKKASYPSSAISASSSSICFTTCAGARSEEHTSELQSLMRNSYAVFCLKNKTQLKSIDHV